MTVSCAKYVETFLATSKQFSLSDSQAYQAQVKIEQIWNSFTQDSHNILKIEGLGNN